jgi:hypothetical protein
MQEARRNKDGFGKTTPNSAKKSAPFDKNHFNKFRLSPAIFQLGQ